MKRSYFVRSYCFQQFQKAFVVKLPGQRVQGPAQRGISLGDLFDEGLRAGSIQFNDSLTQIPPQLRRQFEQYFGIAKPQVLDKSGGLPEVSGQFVRSARPVGADGALPERAARPSREQRWKVRFVDRDTGQPPPAVRVRLHVQTIDGADSYDVVRIVSGDGTLEPSLNGNQLGWVEIVDENYRGGGGARAAVSPASRPCSTT